MTIDDPTAARLVAVLERQEKLLEKLEAKLSADAEDLSLQEAMNFLGVKRRKLFELIKSGHLVRVRDGKRIRITTESAKAYREERARSAGR